MTQPVALVDWGTSSFRLWLRQADGQFTAPVRSGEGMKQAAGIGFERVLETHLETVGAGLDVPVVICGMAGARGGWVEAGYVDCPARLDAIAAAAIRVPGIARRVRILPGLAMRQGRADVLRGEETILLGAERMGLLGGPLRLCLPGTHSKWIAAEPGRVTGFETCMTGELFDILSRHSILSHSVGAEPLATFDPAGAFGDAVRRAFADPAGIGRHLFGIRASALIDATGPEESASTLSGLLVGTEIAGAAPAGQVTLVASGTLRACYEAAFAALGIDWRTLDAEALVLAGLTAAAAHLEGIDP